MIAVQIKHKWRQLCNLSARYDKSSHDETNDAAESVIILTMSDYHNINKQDEKLSNSDLLMLSLLPIEL